MDVVHHHAFAGSSSTSNRLGRVNTPRAVRSRTDRTMPSLPGRSSDCTHVFVRNDAPRPPLSPTYDGPYLVLSRAGKTITICCQNKTKTVSLDRVKPAFLDSGEAPHVRNMQLSPPRNNSQKRRRVTFAKPIEVIS
ncbi:hypothetical protein T05_13696 [Trichinella murrelli]|uniref:Uncharacterized protein n=1 Tax=Trichinella murrelli TaxID=144512 RepID=A0A0V0TCB7_9BILA|nr:hypothetical protein T05_13696 [Trichinella murrelli]